MSIQACMNIKALLFGCIGLMVSMGLTAQFMVKDMAAMQAKQKAAAAKQQQLAPANTELAPVDPNTSEGVDPTLQESGDDAGSSDSPTPVGTSDAANALRSGSAAVMSCAAQKGYAACESALPDGVTLVKATSSGFVISASHQGTMLYASQGSKGTCHWVAGTPDRCNGW